MSNYPEEFRYTKEHEWVKIEGGVGLVGITFHAQKELKRIATRDAALRELLQAGDSDA